MKIIKSETGSVLTGKREEMTRKSWIKNVTRIHPEKPISEVEALYDKIFGRDFDTENPDKVVPL